MSKHQNRKRDKMRADKGFADRSQSLTNRPLPNRQNDSVQAKLCSTTHQSGSSANLFFASGGFTVSS